MTQLYEYRVFVWDVEELMFLINFLKTKVMRDISYLGL